MRDLMRLAAGTAELSAVGQPRGGLVRLRPLRTRTGRGVAVVSAVAVVIAGCASSGTSSTARLVPHPPPSPAPDPSAAAQQGSSSSGAIHFAATVFGLAYNTSAPAQAISANGG